MPIPMTVRETDSDPIVFPLTINDLSFDLTSVTAIALVKSGFDGKLKETIVSGATVTVYSGAVTSGWVKWALTSGDIPAKYGPYRIYFRCSVSGGGDVTVPREDFFLLRVTPVTY